MSNSIIRAEGLGKKYIISHEGRESYTALRDVITRKARKLLTKPNATKRSKEEFWALKNVSFEIKKGEAVGIIGRNGAGKSTLLKILSRITEPSTGRVEINGRVASLLEVGTGFHPELTGRENIFLNGAILGMSRAEIKKKFDEIVDFSGVEKFLDTPVKRFSSGMYVRLAFAVAAHLEPEILVVDEVLAVGDTEFQKKCLGKMDEVSHKEGRTVLFVSHNMGMISQLCNQGILLQNGTVINSGITSDVINSYLEQSSNHVERIERQKGFAGNHFQSIYMCDNNLAEKNEYRFDEEICISLKLNLPEYNDSLELAMRLIDRNKRAVFTIHEKLEAFKNASNEIKVKISVPQKFMTPGRYSWIMCINHPGIRYYDLQDDILPFNIVDTGSDFARYDSAEYGSVFARYSIIKI